MAIDSSLVFYSSLPLTYIDTDTGDDLQTILENINTAVNSMNAAPDYTSYNLYCITQTDGSSHPTNTQNFAEGISLIVCDNKDEYDTFVGTTYVSDQAVVNAAISALQVPALTYSNTAGGSTITITSGMTRNQVLTATYTAVGAIQNLLGAPGSTWSTLAITNPTNINTAFNSIIAYLSSLTTEVDTKQDTIATFDNSTNCLSGTDTDTIRETVALLITYTCDLPVYDASAITWLGISAGVDLQTSIQALVNTVSSILTEGVVDAGTGLTEASVGSTYQGKKLAIDDSYTQLYKVMVTGDVYTDADVLDQKLTSSDSSITMTVTGNQVDMSVTTPNNYKVKVNSSDTTADYLSNKVYGSSDAAWGLATSVSTVTDSQLTINTTLGNPDLTWQNMIYYIMGSPDLLILFNNLVAIAGTVPGTPITDLLVELNGGNFIYTWTAETGNSQQAKWRQRGTALWSTSLLTPANPLSAVAVTTTAALTGVNVPYQFQVDTIYSTGLIGSNIYENIQYECQTLNVVVATQQISVSQDALPEITYLEYNLYNSAVVLVETIITTGSSPSVQFAAVSADTYKVTWRYGVSINGTVLYSDDASQLAAYCEETGIVVV